MKRIWGFILVCLIALGCISLSRAQGTKTNMTTKDESKGMIEESKMTCGHEMMEHKKMMGMCHHMMMSKSMVSTTDGGVIVMIGNKLQKYNKDLVLQKEVEIKVDMESMRKMFKGMCPMEKEMKPDAMLNDSDDQPESMDD